MCSKNGRQEEEEKKPVRSKRIKEEEEKKPVLRRSKRLKEEEETKPVIHRSKKIKEEEEKKAVIRRSKRLKEQEERHFVQRFMSTVTDDLVIEILSRIGHPKHAVRCITVCKSWSSLIRSPPFALSFSEQCRAFELLFWFNNSRFLNFEESRYSKVYLLGSIGESKKVDLDFLPWTKVIVLTSSPIGFLAASHGISPRQLCVCNPMTKQTLFISWPHIGWSHARFGVIINSDRSGHFKIVALQQQSDTPYVKVFCSLDRNWSHVLECESCAFLSRGRETPFFDDNAIAGNGVLYFPMMMMAPMMQRLFYVGIFEFSPFKIGTKDQSRVHKLPNEFSKAWMAYNGTTFFGMVRGRLRVSQLFKFSDEFRLRIWELGLESSWDLVRYVSLRTNSNMTVSNNLIVIAFDPDDGNVIFVVQDNIKIYKYTIIGGDELVEHCKYEFVGLLPISSDYCSRFRKFSIMVSMTVFFHRHSSLPMNLAP